MTRDHIGTLTPKEQALYQRYDKAMLRLYKNIAVSIAQKWLDDFSTDDKKRIAKLVSTYLELWKLECGASRGLASILGAALLGKRLSEEERLLAVENLEPWQAAPMGYDTPIDLWRYIWITRFPDEKRALKRTEYIDGLAWLIIFSDGKKDFRLWPSMIHDALFIAECSGGVANFFKEEALKHGGPAFKKAKALRDENHRRSAGTMPIRRKIHNLASERLRLNIAKSEIAARIASMEDIGLSPKQVRRYLEDHPSGHWKPKKRTRR